jgi:hypothetical protein
MRSSTIVKPMATKNDHRRSAYSSTIIRLAGPVFIGVFGLAILSLRFIEYPEIMKVRTSLDTTRVCGDGGIWMALHLPANGQDRIRPDMKVLIHLDDFPYYKYGVLQGKIAANGCDKMGKGTVEVLLSNGLVTDQGVSIPSGSALEGDALIIKPDVMLYQRLFRNSTPASPGK